MVKKEGVYLIAVDIGGTKISVSIANRKGILARVYQSTNKKGGNKTIPKQVDSLIKYVCCQACIKTKNISSLCFLCAL